MFIYCVIIVVLLFLTIIEDKVSFSKQRTKLIFIFCVCELIFISSMRSASVGADTKVYCDAYNDIDSYWFEPGFTFMVKILNFISKSPQLLIIVSSIIINLSVAYFIYTNSHKCFFSLLIYVLFLSWFNYMNIMRQALATAFILFGFNCLKKKTLKHDLIYLLFVAIACTFHKVGVIGVVFPFLRYLKINKNMLVISAICGIIFFGLADEAFNILLLIFPNYRNYYDTMFLDSNYCAAFLKLLLGYLIFVLVYWGIKQNLFKSKDKCQVEIETIVDKKSDNLFVNITFLYVLMLFCSMKIVLFDRISEFLSIFVVVLIPNFISNYSEKDYKIFKYGVIGLLMAYFFVIAIFRPEWNGCIPYEI